MVRGSGVWDYGLFCGLRITIWDLEFRIFGEGFLQAIWVIKAKNGESN